jgi:hypothetical protein
MRAWVAAHQPSWMTSGRLKLTTAAILAAAVLASGSHLAPNGAPPATAQAVAGPAPAR